MHYRSQHVDFIYQEGTSDWLVVTFNPINIRANGKQFWGDSFFKENGISALGIVSTKRNWFPWEGMEALLENARPILAKYRHICTYGSSMGAYGAIKYSGLIGAKAVVAFSPQHSIDPKDERYPSQFSAYYDEKIHQDVAIRPKDLGGKIFLFYDPHHRVDGYAADCIAGLSPQVNRIPVPFLGHTTIVPFAKAKKGLEILELALAENAPALRRMSREVRRQSRLRPRYLSCALVPHHSAWAFAICEKYPEALEEQNLDYFCKALSQAGKDEIAIKWLRRFVAKCPSDPRGYKNLATFLQRELQSCEAPGFLDRTLFSPWYRRRQDRRFQEIVALMTEAIRLEPQNHRHLLRMGSIHAIFGKSSEAVDWAAKAVEIGPGDAASFKYHATFLKSLGQADRALEVLRTGAAKFPRDPFFTHMETKTKDLEIDLDENEEPVEDLTLSTPDKLEKKKTASVSRTQSSSLPGLFSLLPRSLRRLFQAKGISGRK